MPTKVFQTPTVPSNRTVVQVQLRPDSEMHILIGGPYADAQGERHPYGHAALRIKTPQLDLTYDFGRYGEVRGAFGETGDGILRVWADFNFYIRGENATGRSTTGFAYSIFEHQAMAVKQHFDAQISASTPVPARDRTGMKTYRLATDYHALAPNCTTLSIDGAKIAIPDIDSGSSAFNRPEQVLGRAERAALFMRGGAPRLFLPENLRTFLADGSPARPIRTDTYPQ